MREDKIRLFDSHTHIDFSQYNGIRESIIKEAFDNGVVGIINVGVDLPSSEKSVELAKGYDNIWAAVGFHPHDASKLDDDTFDKIVELAKSEKVVAIGEVGLDFYRKLSPKAAQYHAFERQIALAVEFNLPLIVHSRNSIDETIEFLKKNRADKVGGVLHSFSGETKHIDKGKELNFLFSFNGTITYKNSKAVKSAEYAGLENIIIETDCPFLAPQAHRGKLNKPSYVRYVAEKLSEIFAPKTVAEISAITEANTRKLFKLSPVGAGKIAYSLGGNLYLNITNRCSNNCFFCARNRDYKIGEYNLKLAYEPSESEIMDAIGEDISKYKEIVFCGYGEPTIRLKTLVNVAKTLKKRGAVLRLNTNGQGSLINGRDITDELSRFIDIVSISLNAPTKEGYNRICKPNDEENAFNSIIDFASKSKSKFDKVILSVVDVPKLDIDACRRIADDLGLRLRIRELGKKS